MSRRGTEVEHTADETRPHAVAAAHPLATDAGMSVLAAGGSAIDAAVAIQSVLGLVEPHSSGLAGGTFMLHYEAETRTVTAYEGRVEAPLGAEPSMFLGEEGAPMDYLEASRTGRAFGVPGVVAMLAQAHGAGGKLPWGELFGKAIGLASEGIEVSRRMAGGLELADEGRAQVAGMAGNRDSHQILQGASPDCQRFSRYRLSRRVSMHCQNPS